MWAGETVSGDGPEQENNYGTRCANAPAFPAALLGLYTWPVSRRDGMHETGQPQFLSREYDMTWERLSREDTMTRLAEIDKMFDEAAGWGSWMVSVANEREAMVNSANKRWGLNLEHKWQARTASGGRTD